MNTELGTLATLVYNQNHDEEESAGEHSETHGHRHLSKQRHRRWHGPQRRLQLRAGNNNVPQTRDSLGSPSRPGPTYLWELSKERKKETRCIKTASGHVIVWSSTQPKTHLDPHPGLTCGK